MIADIVAQLRRDIGAPVDPGRRGPVPLNRFFEELSVNVSHVSLPSLTIGGVVEHMRAHGITLEEIGEPTTKLAGFLFFAGRVGMAFVNADEILTRRRFTAAHELGHAILHRERMGRFVADATIDEADESTTEMEREANLFAAELLMPTEVCRARADELRREYGGCPRGVLAYRLAAELLVSREAMRYRLKNLEVGDE